MIPRKEFEIHTFSTRSRREKVAWIAHNRLALKFYLKNCVPSDSAYYQVFSIDNLTGQKRFVKSGRTRARDCRSPIFR